MGEVALGAGPELALLPMGKAWPDWWHMGRDHFSRAVEFLAKLQNMPVSTEFHLHGILQNLVLASDYFYFSIKIKVCKAFWQNCQYS